MTAKKKIVLHILCGAITAGIILLGIFRFFGSVGRVIERFAESAVLRFPDEAARNRACNSVRSSSLRLGKVQNKMVGILETLGNER